jgi:hypothetical protein
MGQVCSICNHPKRVEMDRELVQGKSYAMVGSEFGVSWQSLRNHKENHLSRQLVQAYNKQGLAESMDLLGRIDKILSRAEKIFQRNYDKGDVPGDTLALKALGEQRSTIELLAKISAYLHEARLAELQNSREHFEAEQEALTQERLARLTTDELKMLLYLQHKMQGREVPEHLPPPKPIIRVSETAHASSSEAAPIISAPESEPVLEPEPAPKPKTLPPRRVQIIPGKDGLRRSQW